MKQHLLIFMLLISWTAQASRFVFDRLTVESGLSSSQVTAILQGHDGYIWIGTTEGLNRYDGQTFVHYLPHSGKAESIQGRAIRKLFEDTSGGLWICFASGGISRFNPQTGSFLNFTREWMQQQLRVYGNVNCFSTAIPDRLLIGTDNGLLEYDYASGKLTRFMQTGSVISSTPINCLYTAPNGTLWAGTLSGFSRYDRKQKLFSDHQIQTAEPQEAGNDNLNGVNAIYVDRFGYLWIGTGKKGIFRSADSESWNIFRPVGKLNLTVYCFLETQRGDFWAGHNKGVSRISRENRVSLRSEHFLNTAEALAPTGENPVNVLKEDAYGTVWLSNGHFSQELYYYQAEVGYPIQLKNLPEDPLSISNNQVACFYIDASGLLWVGHPNYGISYCDLNPPLFSYATALGEKKNKLSSNHILAVYEDSEENLWVGTSKGLDRINRSTSEVDRHFAFSSSASSTGLSGKLISSIREDADRHLWVCYLDAAPDRFSLDKLQKEPYSLPSRSSYKSSLQHLTGMVAGRDGFIWFVTGNASLIKFDPANDKAYFYTQPALTTEKKAMTYPEAHSLCTDTDGGIWIGTDGYGLRFLEPNTEVFTDYTHIPEEINSLSSNHIHCLYADKDGILWIGTDMGLDRLDSRNQQFEHFTTEQGLPSNSIQGIQKGESGQLFISTNKGMSLINLTTRQITNYSTANGLRSNEFTANVSCRRKSGDLVFGSYAGLLSFSPARISTDQKKAPDKIQASYSLKGKLGSQELDIRFVAFNYLHPKSIRYKYKLEGFDAAWKEGDSRKQGVTYSKLPSGKYRFYVQASSNGVDWSEPALLNIHVSPAWWSSGWFITLLLIVVSLSLYKLYQTYYPGRRKTEEENVCTPEPVAAKSEIQDQEKEFIRRVTNVVLDNLQNPQFDVDAFCSQMAMSRASLFRKLKSATGCSASAFTRNIRIQKAAQLLEQQHYTIGEIAAMVGFSDPNYFSRCFKEAYGITPSEFADSLPDNIRKTFKPVR